MVKVQPIYVLSCEGMGNIPMSAVCTTPWQRGDALRALGLTSRPILSSLLPARRHGRRWVSVKKWAACAVMTWATNDVNTTKLLKGSRNSFDKAGATSAHKTRERHALPCPALPSVLLRSEGEGGLIPPIGKTKNHPALPSLKTNEFSKIPQNDPIP